MGMLFEVLQGRIIATNHSIGELTSFATRWASLTIMEKRMFNVKAEMVDLVENSWLRYASSFTSGSGFIDAPQKGDTEDQGGEEGKGKPKWISTKAAETCTSRRALSRGAPGLEAISFSYLLWTNY